MIIGVPKEIMHGERRVAATPETVAKFVKDGATVPVENGAGVGAFFADDAYAAAAPLGERDRRVRARREDSVDVDCGGDRDLAVVRRHVDDVVYRTERDEVHDAAEYLAYELPEHAAVREIDDCMLYHEFLLFNGDRLYDRPPEIHINIEHSEREFGQTKAEYLGLFEKLMTEAGYSC